MKIAVLGATGHLGWNIAHRLCELDHDVILVCRPDNVVRVHHFNASIITSRNPVAALQSIEGSVDWIVDAAAPYPVELFVSAKEFNTAEQRTREIVHQCRRLNAGLAFISTFVTQINTHNTLSAKWRRRTSPYLVLKRRLETLVTSSDIKTIVINPTTAIGPGDFKPDNRSFICTLMRNDLPLSYAGQINIIDTRDVAARLCDLLEQNQSFGPALLAGHKTTIEALMRMVAAMTQAKSVTKTNTPTPLFVFGSAVLESLATVANIKTPLPALIPWLIIEQATLLDHGAESDHALQETLETAVTWRLSNANGEI